jgi:hypothetical protein
MEGCGLDLFGSSYGPVEVSCEHDDEPLGYIRDRQFFDYLVLRGFNTASIKKH